MYQKGCFTIENANDLYKAGIEQGFVAREEKPEITLLVDIESAIKGNKVKALKKILDSVDSATTINNILMCAREYFDGLSNEMVDLIQDATGVDLRIE